MGGRYGKGRAGSATAMRATVAGLAAVLLLAGVPAAQAAWTAETDCAACHADQAAAMGAGDHAVLTCATCHVDQDKLADVHDAAAADAKLPTKLKKTKIGDEVCLTCHGDGQPFAPQAQDGEGQAADEKAPKAESEKAADEMAPAADEKAPAAADKASSGEKTDAAKAPAGEKADADAPAVPGKTQLAAATASSEVLTDAEGTVVNPHDVPVNKSHDALVCIDCHKLHDAEPDPAKTAGKKCVSCHHDNVYECYTCHD